MTSDRIGSDKTTTCQRLGTFCPRLDSVVSAMQRWIHPAGKPRVMDLHPIRVLEPMKSCAVGDCG